MAATRGATPKVGDVRWIFSFSQEPFTPEQKKDFWSETSVRAVMLVLGLCTLFLGNLLAAAPEIHAMGVVNTLLVAYIQATAVFVSISVLISAFDTILTAVKLKPGPRHQPFYSDPNSDPSSREKYLATFTDSFISYGLNSESRNIYSNMFSLLMMLMSFICSACGAHPSSLFIPIMIIGSLLYAALGVPFIVLEEKPESNNKTQEVTAYRGARERARFEEKAARSNFQGEDETLQINMHVFFIALLGIIAYPLTSVFSLSWASLLPSSIATVLESMPFQLGFLGLALIAFVSATLYIGFHKSNFIILNKEEYKKGPWDSDSLKESDPEWTRRKKDVLFYIDRSEPPNISIQEVVISLNEHSERCGPTLDGTSTHTRYSIIKEGRSTFIQPLDTDGERIPLFTN